MQFLANKISTRVQQSLFLYQIPASRLNHQFRFLSIPRYCEYNCHAPAGHEDFLYRRSRGTSLRTTNSFVQTFHGTSLSNPLSCQPKAENQEQNQPKNQRNAVKKAQNAKRANPPKGNPEYLDGLPGSWQPYSFSFSETFIFWTFRASTQIR